MLLINLERRNKQMNGLDVIEIIETSSKTDTNNSWHESWPDGWRDSHR